MCTCVFVCMPDFKPRDSQWTHCKVFNLKKSTAGLENHQTSDEKIMQTHHQKHLLHHAEDHLTVVPVSFCPRLCKNHVGATCHVIPEESGSVHGHLFCCGTRSEKLGTMNLSNEKYVVLYFLLFLEILKFDEPHIWINGWNQLTRLNFTYLRNPEIKLNSKHTNYFALHLPSLSFKVVCW